MSEHRLVLVAAAALFDERGRVLLTERPPGKSLAGLMEFPGGKVEAGESPENALIRELQEELGITIAAHTLTPLSFASHAYQDFHLLMPLFACTHWLGEPQSLEGQTLNWLAAEALSADLMPPADAPLILPVQAWAEELRAQRSL
jgi:8-oxo-dGTP diphosphatase